MIEFTVAQYDKAIEDLQAARNQKIENTWMNGCSICGGCCHPDTCGFNPLYAMAICSDIASISESLHKSLHYAMGVNTLMGESIGPAKVVMPSPNEIVEDQPVTDE